MTLLMAAAVAMAVFTGAAALLSGHTALLLAAGIVGWLAIFTARTGLARPRARAPLAVPSQRPEVPTNAQRGRNEP